MKTEAKVCAVCLFIDAMNSLCCPVLLSRADGGQSLPVWCAALMFDSMYVCVRAFTGATQFRLGRNLLLFSLSHLALFLLFLLPLFPPSSCTALPSERGRREVLSALFENVITIIMMMTVLMMIIVPVKTKGGVSERVSSSWGEETSAL